MSVRDKREMLAKKIYITFLLLFIHFPAIHCQSELAGITPFLNRVITTDLADVKKYVTTNDSIETFRPVQWINDCPISVWLDTEPFRKTITMICNHGKLSQLLVENIADTSGLFSFCSTNGIHGCALFKGYRDQYKDRKVINWIVLCKLESAGGRIISKPEVEVWDSTSYYLEVLKNPVFEYNYGFSCYESGDPPLGRFAIHYLQKKNKVALLTDISACNNNEGLMYIAEYYIRQKITLPAGFEKVLRRKISYCDGCTDFGSMTIERMIKELNDNSTRFGSYLKEEIW